MLFYLNTKEFLAHKQMVATTWLLPGAVLPNTIDSQCRLKKLSPILYLIKVCYDILLN